MTDLRKIDAKSNPYFQNLVIRQHLIKAGLINRKGDIIHPSAIDVSPEKSTKVRKTRENIAKAVDDNVTEEEKKRKGIIRNQIDLSIKHVHVKKNKKPKPPQRSHSPSPTNEKHSPKRVKSANPLLRDSEKRLLHRSANDKSPTKSKCRVIMVYYGPKTMIDYDKSWFQQEGDEIIVMQQHCGGENLTVFRGFIKPNETFAFDSQRHIDYPFALALYINGLIDCRVSVCCEYKHKRNVPLGGPHGLFAITDIQQVTPCRSCRFKRLQKKKKSKSSNLLILEPSRYQKSVVPRMQTRNSSRSPDSHRVSTPTRTAVSHYEKDHKRSSLPTDNRPISSKVRNKHTSKKQKSPRISRTPTPTVNETDKQPPILSNKQDSSVVPNGNNSTSQSSDIPQTPTPLSPKKSTIPPSRKSSTDSEINKKTRLIKSKSPMDLQNNSNNNNDNSENYTSDFDEANDDDDNDVPKKNSRFGQPRISDPQSSDRDHGDSNVQSKSSFNILNPTDTSDEEKHRFPTKTSPEKEDKRITQEKSSSNISRKSDDEDNKRLSQRFKGKMTTADDSRPSSSNTSRRSSPSLSTKSDHNRFSSSKISNNKNLIVDQQATMDSIDDLFETKRPTTAVKKTANTQHSSPTHHRNPSNSSDDFLGIKRNTNEQKPNTDIFSKDWFESNSRNDLDTTSKNITWQKDNFFD